MSKHSFFIFLLSLAFFSCPGKTQTQPPKEIKETPPAPEVSFSRDVLPILLELGGECHNPDNKAGNYALNSYEEIMAGGTDSIPNVIPGKPDSSLLYIYLVKGHPFGVKPDSAKLKLVYNWILQGAKNN